MRARSNWKTIFETAKIAHFGRRVWPQESNQDWQLQATINMQFASKINIVPFYAPQETEEKWPASIMSLFELHSFAEWIFLNCRRRWLIVDDW